MRFLVRRHSHVFSFRLDGGRYRTGLLLPCFSFLNKMILHVYNLRKASLQSIRTPFPTNEDGAVFCLPLQIVILRGAERSTQLPPTVKQVAVQYLT